MPALNVGYRRPRALGTTAALLLALTLGACAADPASLGITGPAPVAPPEERPALEAGTGVVFDPNRPGGSTGGRFWRAD